MSERVSEHNRSGFSAPTITADLNGVSVHIFVAEARKVAPYCIVSKREVGIDDAYQRIFMQSRVNAIEQFINEGGAVLPAIVLSADAQSTLPYEITNSAHGQRIKFSPGGDYLFVVDGQHRLRGACETSVNLVFVLAEGLDAKAQAHQFVVINQNAHRIPTSLLKDLLPWLDEYFDVDDPQKRLREVCVLLDESPTSVLKGKIERFRQNAPGKISLNNFDRKWRPHFDPDGILGMDTAEEAFPVVRDYFGALALNFPEAWNDKKGNLFLKTLIFGAFSTVFSTVYRIAAKFTDSTHPGTKEFAKALEGIKGEDLTGYLEMGTGAKIEKIVAKELLTKVKGGQ